MPSPGAAFLKFWDIYIDATASPFPPIHSTPSSTSMSVAANPDRDVTSTGRARPMCHHCSQYKKNHNLALCLTIQQAKQDFSARQISELPTKLEEAAPSISQAGASVRNPAAASTLPQTEDVSVGDIVLPVRRKPNLTGRYAGRYSPILELTILLELKSLQVSHFHLTRAGDWSFLVTGNRASVADWVAETKVQIRGSIKPRRNCLHNATILALGMVLGVLILFSVAYLSVRI